MDFVRESYAPYTQATTILLLLDTELHIIFAMLEIVRVIDSHSLRHHSDNYRVFYFLILVNAGCMTETTTAHPAFAFSFTQDTYL